MVINISECNTLYIPWETAAFHLTYQLSSLSAYFFSMFARSFTMNKKSLIALEKEKWYLLIVWSTEKEAINLILNFKLLADNIYRKSYNQQDQRAV